MTKRISLNYNIEVLEDRLSYVREINNIDNYNRNKWALYGDMDFNIEKITNFILRSKDVESCRKIEYSFFGDESSFWSRYKKKFNDRSEELPPKTFMVNSNYIDVNPALPSHSIIQDDFSENEIIDRFFATEMSAREKRKVIGLPKKLFKSIESERLIDQIACVFEMAYKNCKDQIDIDCMRLLEEGLTEAEIAKTIGISRSSVNNRINKVLND